MAGKAEKKRESATEQHLHCQRVVLQKLAKVKGVEFREQGDGKIALIGTVERIYEMLLDDPYMDGRM